MLDNRSLALLNYINGECVNSGYKIFSYSELVFALPKTLKSDKENVIESVNHLSSREYVTVKYQDGDEVCLCPTVKGRTVFETRLQNVIDERRKEKKYFLACLTGSFVGSLVGLIIYALIGALL